MFGLNFTGSGLCLNTRVFLSAHTEWSVEDSKAIFAEFNKTVFGFQSRTVSSSQHVTSRHQVQKVNKNKQERPSAIRRHFYCNKKKGFEQV